MSVNGATVDERIRALVEPVKEALEELDARRAELVAELEAIDADRRRLVGVLSKALPEEYGPRARAASSRRVRAVNALGVDVAPRTVERVEAFLATSELKTFNGRQLAIAMSKAGDPIGRDTARKALLVLHDQGRVTLLGRQGVGGARQYRLAPSA
jgi:hypothetical protein